MINPTLTQAAERLREAIVGWKQCERDEEELCRAGYELQQAAEALLDALESDLYHARDALSTEKLERSALQTWCLRLAEEGAALRQQLTETHDKLAAERIAVNDEFAKLNAELARAKSEVEEMRKAGVREVNRITFEAHQKALSWSSALGDLAKERDALRAQLSEAQVERDELVGLNERLSGALVQALDQWRYYRGETSSDNLDESNHTEAKLFRSLLALSNLSESASESEGK